MSFSPNLRKFCPAGQHAILSNYAMARSPSPLLCFITHFDTPSPPPLCVITKWMSPYSFCRHYYNFKESSSIAHMFLEKLMKCNQEPQHYFLAP